MTQSWGFFCGRDDSRCARISRDTTVGAGLGQCTSSVPMRIMFGVSALSRHVPDPVLGAGAGARVGDHGHRPGGGGHDHSRRGGQGRAGGRARRRGQVGRVRAGGDNVQSRRDEKGESRENSTMSVSDDYSDCRVPWAVSPGDATTSSRRRRNARQNRRGCVALWAAQPTARGKRLIQEKLSEANCRTPPARYRYGEKGPTVVPPPRPARPT